MLSHAKTQLQDQDFFNVVENCVSVEQDSKCNNRWGACFDLKNVGLVKLVKNKIKEHSDHTLLPINCVIHQESLYKVVLNINHVINPVVSVMKLIRAVHLTTGSSGHCLKIFKLNIMILSNTAVSAG